LNLFLSNNEGKRHLEGSMKRCIERCLGFKEMEITGDWRKLHKKELYD
jgi:hypothetical protein